MADEHVVEDKAMQLIAGLAREYGWPIGISAVVLLLLLRWFPALLTESGKRLALEIQDKESLRAEVERLQAEADRWREAYYGERERHIRQSEGGDERH